MNSPTLRPPTACLLLTLLAALPVYSPDAQASTTVVNKVYTPYVQPLEKEIEYRFLGTTKTPTVPAQQWHRLGAGLSPVEHWFTELYVIASDSTDQELSIDAYEAEAKWQLSEQGEYLVDWGFLFELEKHRSISAWEFSTGLLALKEWRHVTAVANILLGYEWGDDTDEELEASAALQVNYRWKPQLEPGIELFINDEDAAAGPALFGQVKLGPGKTLLWKAGYLFGMQSGSSDTLSISVEYEFF